MTTVIRNTVAGFAGSWGSGLGYLLFEDGSSIPCENGATVRALDAATGGNAIGEGHTVDNDGISGLEIVYFEDDFGLILGGFVLYDDWLNDLPEIFPGTPYDLEDGQLVDSLTGEILWTEAD